MNQTAPSQFNFYTVYTVQYILQVFVHVNGCKSTNSNQSTVGSIFGNIYYHVYISMTCLKHFVFANITTYRGWQNPLALIDHVKGELNKWPHWSLKATKWLYRPHVLLNFFFIRYHLLYSLSHVLCAIPDLTCPLTPSYDKQKRFISQTKQSQKSQFFTSIGFPKPSISCHSCAF